MKHKVWIELPNHDHETHAALATKMLHKLGFNESVDIWWNESKRLYCLTTNSSGEFLQLNDHGHWFDLDFIAK